MKLNENLNVLSFLTSVEQCAGDVYVSTPDGDHLNLKSGLCRMIFSVAATRSQLLVNAELHCANTADLMLLKEYITF